MNVVTVVSMAAIAVIGIGVLAVAWAGYRLLYVWAEDRAREKRYADEWQRQHVSRRQAGK